MVGLGLGIFIHASSASSLSLIPKTDYATLTMMLGRGVET